MLINKQSKPRPARGVASTVRTVRLISSEQQQISTIEPYETDLGIIL